MEQPSSTSKMSKKKWFFPLIMFQAYLSLTVVLYFYGPWPWPTSDPFRLGVFLLLSQIFIFVGYVGSYSHFKKRNNNLIGSSVGNALNAQRLSMIVTGVFIAPTALSRSGSFIPDMISGILSSGQVYNEFQAVSGSFVIVEYGRIVFAPLLVAFFPLTIFFWKDLSRLNKLLSTTLIFYWLSIYIASGTSKGLADFIITFPFLLVVRRFWMPPKSLAWKKPLAGLIVIFLAFLMFFGEGQKGREGGVGENGVFNDGADLITSDRFSGLSAVLGDNQLVIYESLTRYVVQGYYALDMAFDIESRHTGFLGHSMFLSAQGNTVTGSTYFTDNSVPGVLEQETGYGMYSLWHSIYVWLMSDFGYFGTLLCMMVFGYSLAIFWIESMFRPSMFSLAGLYLLVILFFYIPANNQIFQNGESTMAFLFIGVIFVLKKIQRKI